MHSRWAACIARGLTHCATPCAQGIALLLVAAAVALLAVSASASQARTRADNNSPSATPSQARRGGKCVCKPDRRA